MAVAGGLKGLRASEARVAEVTTPPYDVIKEGSPLEALLGARPDSFYHVTLGQSPREALAALISRGALVEDQEPAFYVYEQRWSGGRRLGVLSSVEVTPYSDKQVIRHEKTFDDKVQGRIAVTKATGYTLEPIFLLTRAEISPLLEKACDNFEALYAFRSDFGGAGDLDGIDNRIFRVPEEESLGREIRDALGGHPLYIADGHHRYHAALLGGQDRAMAYIVENARILAYNRVISGERPIAEALSSLDLQPATDFATPPKHHFCLYSKRGVHLVRAREVPDDVVGRLDCRILERELYPQLGVDRSMIRDKKHFDYYPEHDLPTMRALVDDGTYDLAVALSPVSLEELMAVADAGLDDPEIVMPQKSTFFAPKILSGLVLHKHGKRA